MNKHVLHFWYEFASPYAYLSAMRIEDVARENGVRVVWHPFLLGAIYKRMKLPAPPMQLNPAKEKYMWLDATRQARDYGFKLNTPSQFPRVAVLPARLALLGMKEGWGKEFSRRVYLANFVDDRDISQEEILTPILKDLGLSPNDVLAKALSDENKSALREETDKAYDLGIFGVPTFFAGPEMFWGDDRLEKALKAIKD